jgi:integrase
MLSDDISRFIELRQSLGFKFRVSAGLLRNFAGFAEIRGESVLRNQTARDWSAHACSPAQRHERLSVIRRFALHMQVEDPRYEVPPAGAFGKPVRRRRKPHIYTSEEIHRLLYAAARLTPAGSIRPDTYVTLLALIVSTGLRISEALALQFEDLSSDGLLVRKTKFRKNRLVPLHPTAKRGLDQYLALRQRIAGADRSVFVSLRGTGLRYSTVGSVFLELMRSVALRGRPGTPGPCIHDLRHTFAVRSLEACPSGDREIARHTLALSTYLGHSHPSDTYWYFEAIPKLLETIRRVTETFFEGDRP